jgi:hypothetical protein
MSISQLESLKFKANQIIDSIQTLQRVLESGGHNLMPPWPDILSKFNIILSQSLNFSNSLLLNANATNVFEKISLHPNTPMSDAQLDNDLIPLLRNQQTTDVLRAETDSVRRLSEHMPITRGSLGVLLSDPTSKQGAKKPEYEDVLAECDQIRREHDMRVERAVRAVTMLKDKFDWRQRVEVEVEEPEELDWDPRIVRDHHHNKDGMESEGTDEDEVEGALVHSVPSVTTDLPVVVSPLQSKSSD